MRISEACIYAVVIGAGLGLPPVLAFDGTHGSAPAPMLTLDAPAVPGPPPSMGFDPSVRGTVPTRAGRGP